MSEHHGWNPILNCWSSLRKFESDALIILVNNYPHPIHPLLSQDKNLRYFANTENYWELGAIQTAFNKNPDIDIFFIVQDGVTFTNKPVDFQDDIMFWENEFRNDAPDLDIIESWCKEYFPQLLASCKQKENRICHGLMACLTYKTLQAIMDMGLKDIRVKNKAEACSSESIFGFLLRTYKPTIPYYNEAGASMMGYHNDPSKYEFMVKKAYGRISGHGNSLMLQDKIYYCSMASSLHPIHPFQFSVKGFSYSSLIDAMSKNSESTYHSLFMNYYIANRNALLEITADRYTSYQIEGNQYNINYYIKKFHHDLYVLKHWGYYFHPEFYDESSDTSFLCDFAYHYRKNIRFQYNQKWYTFSITDNFNEEIQIRSCINEIMVRNDYKLDNYVNMEDKVFVDIGANHGVAAIILAKQNPSSTVYAFEPDPKCYKYLEENICLNNLTNLFPFQMAVCKEGIETIHLMVSPVCSGANTVKSTPHVYEKFFQKQITQVSVPAISLDALVRKHNIKEIELVKIDCEGAEYEILYESTFLKERKINNIVGEFHRLSYLTLEDSFKNNPHDLQKYISDYIKGIIIIHT